MNARWQDLKTPVIEAGLGLSLNAFPDLYIAFYRWALWRLFEAEGALGRGILAFITNRGFLTGSGFGGLRKMLRQRFDRIRIIDLRGDNRGVRPATVPFDENVFNIEVGVSILIAHASGESPEGPEASVSYADAWAERAFTRKEKLELALAAATNPARLTYREVEGRGMDRLKPFGFTGTDWPAIDEIFTFRSNGIVTYRDAFVYATDRNILQTRIRTWLRRPADQARREFGESAMNKYGPASRVAFDESAIEPVSYRPFDIRYLYNRAEYVDRPRPDLRKAWGSQNIALFARQGTGAGPAAWCHGVLPDQHAFRGSYGGWVFPFRHHAAEGMGYFLASDIMPGLSGAYGMPVEPQKIFDAVLTLLSATSYTTRFAHDLEDDFPHVPFPADPSLFQRVAEIGARLRALQSFAEKPAPEFRRARLVGRASGSVLDLPTPQRAFTANAGVGQIALLADRSLRVTDISERAWQFSISGYPVLYRWLRARNGEPINARLQRAVLETIGRIEETLHLFDRADELLVEALRASLTRAQIGLPDRAAAAVEFEEILDDSA